MNKMMGQIFLASSFLGALMGQFVFGATPEPNNATCQCMGVDYSDEGSYFIDATEHGNFSFTSEFNGSHSSNEFTKYSSAN